MLRPLAPLLAFATACGSGQIATTPALSTARTVFQEAFAESALQPAWGATVPSVVGAGVSLDDPGIRLALPPGREGDVVVRHGIDELGARGKRGRVSARVRTDLPAQSFVTAMVSVATDQLVPSHVVVPGGFDVRFTGMRVARADGSTIQGHGITPDELVHPTLEGIRAGRDEVLEAGIAAARRLLEP